MTGWLLKLATGNPVTLLWIAGAIAVAAGAAGATGAWTVQGWRLDAAKAEYAVFKGKTEAMGNAAAAKAKAEIDRQAKLLKETEATSAKLKSDLDDTHKRLRVERARSSRVPTVTSTANFSDGACIRGANLLGALRRFDDAVTGDLQTAREGIAAIVEPADDITLRLKISRDWALNALK